MIYGNATQYGHEFYEPELGYYPFEDDGLGSLTSIINAGLTNAGSILTTYWTQQSAVEAAKAATATAIAQQDAAKGAGTAAANLDAYMPYILGIGALMAVAVVISATKK